jgi:hypothetical protein
MLFWAQSMNPAMPARITEPARGDDVFARVSATILTCEQMLRSAFESVRFPLSDAVLSCELGRTVFPHATATIVTVAALESEGQRTGEGKRTGFGNVIGHERLLSQKSVSAARP